MGGAAYNIPGRVDARLIPTGPLPPPTRAPFWRQLLGAPTISVPRQSHLVVSSNGDRHFEILPGALEHDLPKDFLAWLRERLGSPSRASAVILEYLQFGGPSIYVRGLHRSGESEPEFWVQVSFSGCAGEAQVSADVAAHWSAEWHRARADEIRDEYLLPFGFTPAPYDASRVDDRPFLPAGDLGYLEFTDPDSRDRFKRPMFVLDHDLEERFARSAQDIEDRFARFMVDPRCRCQICEPAFTDLVYSST